MENVIEKIITYQGEGSDTGKRVLMIRFKHCNKNCIWCDTKDKMMNTEEINIDIEEIQDIIDKEFVGLMITGGEPTLPGEQFNSTLSMLTKLRFPFANVETNGYKLDELITMVDATNHSNNITYSYSPKIFNSTDYIHELKNIEKFKDNPNIYYKIVYEKENTFLPSLFNEFVNYNIRDRVYIMPKGTKHYEMIENTPYIFDICEQYKFNFSSRIHIVFNFK